MTTKFCVICGRGSLEPGHTTTTMHRGRSTVVVRDAPALLCGDCGEAYFDGETTDRLLEIAETAFRSGAEVVVRDYNTPAVAA
jgi:YgiT-type zinc finger domain-containing protein